MAANDEQFPHQLNVSDMEEYGQVKFGPSQYDDCRSVAIKDNMQAGLMFSEILRKNSFKSTFVCLEGGIGVKKSKVGENIATNKCVRNRNQNNLSHVAEPTGFYQNTHGYRSLEALHNNAITQAQFATMTYWPKRNENRFNEATVNQSLVISGRLLGASHIAYTLFYKPEDVEKMTPTDKVCMLNIQNDVIQSQRQIAQSHLHVIFLFECDPEEQMRNVEMRSRPCEQQLTREDVMQSNIVAQQAVFAVIPTLLKSAGVNELIIMRYVDGHLDSVYVNDSLQTNSQFYWTDDFKLPTIPNHMYPLFFLERFKFMEI